MWIYEQITSVNRLTRQLRQLELTGDRLESNLLPFFYGNVPISYFCVSSFPIQAVLSIQPMLRLARPTSKKPGDTDPSIDRRTDDSFQVLRHPSSLPV